MKNGVVISDCADDNAVGRQQARFASLFGSIPSFIRLSSDAPDLEAAGSLVDTLDAIRQLPKSVTIKPMVVLVNVAPRGSNVKAKWDNGTPFCYFQLDNVLVVSTYDGLTLSLVRDLGIVSNVKLLDIPTVTDSLAKRGVLSASEAKKIKHTQFRSLEFLPLAAYWLSSGEQIPSKEVTLEKRHNEGGKVWFVDCFGNAKTTLCHKDITLDDGNIKLKGLLLPYYERLTDVPDDSFALVEGSSGYGKSRFLEIVKQRGNAANELNLSVGSSL
jgi:hypothetical protein